MKKGQSLFVIDQVPYQAALRVAAANVEVAEAQFETARLDYDSKRFLFDEKVISEYDLSTAKNTLAIAKANLEQAKAQEINARNNLTYTEVLSPVDGVVGTLPFRAGGAGRPDHLKASDNSVGHETDVRLFLYEREPDPQPFPSIRLAGRDNQWNA